MERHSELTNFIWAIADLLRHDYKQSDYGKVILPLTVLRRLDNVLEPTKDKVLAVQPSPSPVFTRMSKAKDVFWAKLGNSTHEVTGNELLQYIQQQWTAAA